ncbi:MAG: tetratricopeptide repeat protein, partial [Chlorobiaceae bacterium]
TLGWILFKMKEYQQAQEHLEKAAQLDPREPEILDHLAEVYDQLGNPEKANETREQSTKLKKK